MSDHQSWENPGIAEVSGYEGSWRDRGLPEPRQAGRSWIELAGAAASAIAWPVFQNATSGPDAFTRIRADQADLILFGLVATLALPTVLLLLEIAAGLASRRSARLFHGVALGLLFGLVCAQAADGAGLDGPWPTLVWIASASTIALLWLKTEFVRTMAVIFGLALPVTLVSFWFVGPGAAVMAGEPSAGPGTRGTGGPPMVMLIFDEFPLAALENRQGRIDASLFPNFAALARQSDWYANARSAADETVGAVPAMLTGRQPDSSQTPPASHNYPDNLFTVLADAGYEVRAEEQVTDLCPHDICPDRGSRGSRLARIGRNGLEFGSLRPSAITDAIDRRLAPVATGSLRVQTEWSRLFREELEPRPGSFDMLHLLLPHVPWTMLPDGRSYENPYLDGVIISPGKGDGAWVGRRNQVDSSFQRFMLQARFIDDEIGRLIAKLKRRGVWKETMLVVVADHGASFAAGSSRRLLTEGNSGWILPVPLFVKAPGQVRGGAVERSFSTAGLAALILKELKIEGPETIPGEKEARIPTEGTVTALSTIHGVMELPESEVRARFDAAREYRNETFAGDNLFAIGGRPGLLGRPARRAGLRPLGISTEYPWPVAEVDTGAAGLPVYVSGVIPGGDCPDSMALAVNARITATTRPWLEDGTCRFAVVVNPDDLRDGLNRLSAYSVE